MDGVAAIGEYERIGQGDWTQYEEGVPCIYPDGEWIQVETVDGRYVSKCVNAKAWGNHKYNKSYEAQVNRLLSTCDVVRYRKGFVKFTPVKEAE